MRCLVIRQFPWPCSWQVWERNPYSFWPHFPSVQISQEPPNMKHFSATCDDKCLESPERRMQENCHQLEASLFCIASPAHPQLYSRTTKDRLTDKQINQRKNKNKRKEGKKKENELISPETQDFFFSIYCWEGWYMTLISAFSEFKASLF